MNKIYILIFSMLIFLTIHAEKMVISMPYVSIERIQEYINDGYDIAQVFPNESVHLVVNLEEKEYFEQKYSSVNILFTETEMRENINSSYRSVTAYQTYPEIVNRLISLATQYPDICKLIELGPSQGKIYFDNGNNNYSDFDHTIYALKVSNDVHVLQDKPNYYFMGGVHAREPLSSEVVMAILEDLLDTYLIGRDVNHPINTSQIYFIPAINPDGKHVVLSSMNTMQRKTITDNNNNGVFDTYSDGIDLNRNFSYKFGTTGISWTPSQDTYPGPRAFSTPEARYIRELAAEVPFIAGISYHTYGNYVLYGYGYGYNSVSHNHEAISALATELASLIPRFTNPSSRYTAMPSWQLYPASGDSEDYLHNKHNILSYCIELGDSFIPNATTVAFHTENNIPAAYHLISRHKTKFLTGLIKDEITGLPVRAEIFVHPNDSFHPERDPIYSDIHFGRFNYPLMPGHYTLEIRADNYYPYYTEFEIFNDIQTVINIDLTPAELFSKKIKIIHSDNSEIFYNADIVVHHNRTNTFKTDDIGRFNLTNISPGLFTIIITATDKQIYITDIFLSENDLRYNSENETVLCFDDFTFIDDFESSLTNWSFQNWAITMNDSYHGRASVNTTSYSSNTNLTLLNPIDIPPDQKVYISFMARFAETMQSGVFIEFDISNNRQNWTTVSQIRNTSGWEHFYFIIPENNYEQVYFRFRMYRYGSSSASRHFNVDLFSVRIGDAIVIEPLIPNPIVLLTPEDNSLDIDLSPYFTWELPSDDINISGLKFYLSKDENIWEDYTEIEPETTEYKLEEILDENTQYYWKIIVYNEAGCSEYNEIFTFITKTETPENDNPITPLKTELIGNYPNPFNPTSTIFYNLSQREYVKLQIFNIRGQLIYTLIDDIQNAGSHSIDWHGYDNNFNSVSSGIYFYRLESSSGIDTRRMLLMK